MYEDALHVTLVCYVTYHAILLILFDERLSLIAWT